MQVLTAERIFDGTALLEGHALVIDGAQIAAVVPLAEAPPPTARLAGTLAPAFLDLQVNGGGGHQIGAGTDLAGLVQVCATHRALGCAGVLPTLITDTPEVTAQVIAAGIAAARQGVPGFLGLHLEGPHLDPARHGAHDPALIRPMDEDALNRLCAAAGNLPALMVTLAPASVSPDQIARLTAAGVIVSLGHADCSIEQAEAAFAAGATCATHLFNAMSQLQPRAPGLVGAVLAGKAQAGLIADLIHVQPAALRVALAARAEGLFLVSDCMGLAGTALTEMHLNGRKLLRSEGKLTLEDGTLAGADLTLDQAIANLVGLGIAPTRALAMTSAEPARLIGLSDRFGRLEAGRVADLVWLGPDWRLRGQWFGGQRLDAQTADAAFI